MPLQKIMTYFHATVTFGNYQPLPRQSTNRLTKENHVRQPFGPKTIFILEVLYYNNPINLTRAKQAIRIKVGT
jgi:hypothetical protein